MTLSQEDTFPRILNHNSVRFTNKIAMRHKDYGIWKAWTWKQVRQEVRDFASGLRALGMEDFAKVAIIGSNRPRLYWTMCAVQCFRGVPVPVYADSVAEEMAYVLEHADVTFAVVQDQEQVDKLLSIADKLPKLKLIIYDEPRGLRDYDHTTLKSFTEVQQMGRASGEAGQKELDASVAAGKAADIGIMLYTSGTTGRPKGVMHTNDNIIISARNGAIFDNLTENEETIAYLPIAWVGDHVFSYGQSYVCGFSVSCPEGAETVAPDRRELGTTYAFAPPRIYENLLTATMVQMEDAAPFKRKMFHYFIAHAKLWGEKIMNKESVPFSARLIYALGDFFVYAPLKNRFGISKVRIAYTAGEAIGPEIFSFFRSLGINLKQLYGQTEAAVYITAQKDGEIFADTVGTPNLDVDVKIDDNGEVLFKSPGVFVGYYKDDEKTKETKTADGYVRTGDAGFFDVKTGQLRIIDRAKDVGKLKNGALYAPKYIENKLKFYPNIKEAVALGQNEDFVTVMLNIDLTAVGSWAERHNVNYASYQELAGHKDVYAMLKRHVEEVNASLANEPMMAQSQIKRFLVLHKELDADDGELTRTQKVRRGFIAERYAALKNALYNGAIIADISTEVTFEDGRKGAISAKVKIEDTQTFAVKEQAA
jgi:long-chain acyl-CoA synthetase